MAGLVLFKSEMNEYMNEYSLNHPCLNDIQSSIEKWYEIINTEHLVYCVNEF